MDVITSDRHQRPDRSALVSFAGNLRDLARGLGCAGFVANTAPAPLVLRALQRAAGGSPWSEYVDVDL